MQCEKKMQLNHNHSLDVLNFWTIYLKDIGFKDVKKKESDNYSSYLALAT